MKKKILAICLVAALTATAAISGTLAYFTDKDAQTNTFTTGNVAIDLYEDFDNDGNGFEKLMPVTYNADGTRNPANVVEKEVYVENTGSEDAFVRVHIAIPTILDDGDPSFDASKNIVHFNFDSATAAAEKWDWSKAADDGVYTGNWNFYTTDIYGKDYNVYVVTYETALTADATTDAAMTQVYMDSSVTNEDITRLKGILGDEWKIYVAAEGAQAAGFNTAYDALNTAFGVPGKYDVAWEVVAAEGEKTFVDLDSSSAE